MRAVVQNIPVQDSWDRYLGIEGQSSDARVVRSTIHWIRAELVRAALRADKLRLARVLKIDVERIAALTDPVAGQPSLAVFAEEHGLEDASEAEQLQAYEAFYGQASRHVWRRQRLVARQLDALRWLEWQVAQAPQVQDALRAWFSPALASHLEAGHLHTLGQLLDHINGLGHHWWRSLKAIGPVKAQRVVQWLRTHHDSLGGTVGLHVDIPVQRLTASARQQLVPRGTAVVPLEKLQVPSELDGRHGVFRLPQAQCLLQAPDDLSAVQSWLASKAAHSHTQRAYRKEAERWVLWAIVQRHKPLSSMTQEDCVAYRDFLADPQPRSRWCGPRNRQRWSSAWRPFEGPLSTTAQRYAITVLKNLYVFLVDHNYLTGNPWRAISVPRSATPRLQTSRSLTLAQWRWLEVRLQSLPTSSVQQRLALAVHWLYATGLRLSEVVSVRVGDLQWVQYPDEAGEAGAQGWWLKVLGKGHKLREVPVPEALILRLQDYLASRGLPADVTHPDNTQVFVLGKASDLLERAPHLAAVHELRPQDGIAAATLYEQLKRFFQDCARQLRLEGDHKSAERLARASTHWLRHTHASHTIAQGLPLEMAQQNLGHASLATTTVYVTTEKQQRLKAMKKLWTTS